MKFYALILLIFSVAVFFSYLSPSTVGEATKDTNRDDEYQPVKENHADLTEEEALRALLTNVNDKERNLILQKVEDVKRKGPQFALGEKIDEIRESYLEKLEQETFTPLGLSSSQ